jgi:MoxR-like ATPase
VKNLKTQTKASDSDSNNPVKEVANLESNTYLNNSPVLNLGGTDFTLTDIVKTGLCARLNIGLAGGAGMGKSQLLSDVQSWFGNNASYVLGRNDLDIKSLYRELNFKNLKEAMDKGGAVSQKEMSKVTSEIHKPLIIVEEINRAAEVVQNQLFNIFEGFIEIDGTKYALGDGKLETYKGIDGKEFTKNTNYSIGLWSANFGNGQYTGTVSMDKALKERSHLIIDIDNFPMLSEDLDSILLGNSGEVRLKEQEKPSNNTKAFVDAFHYFKQKSFVPDKKELTEELLLFRYLVNGLDYISCESAKNSKRILKEVWPSKAEEDNIGSDEDDIVINRMVYPASVRSAQTILMFARSLREYAKAKNPNANPTVLDSVIESFKLAAPYSGIVENEHRIRENYAGNRYLASCKVADIIKKRFVDKSELINAFSYFKIQNKPIPKNILDECKDDFNCFK